MQPHLRETCVLILSVVYLLFQNAASARTNLLSTLQLEKPKVTINGSLATPFSPGPPTDELAQVVHKNVYYENHTDDVVEQASLIRQVRRSIRRRVSKSPAFFHHEVPHITDWQKKLDDLEDSETRADMVGHHMTDKWPSDLAGDVAKDRLNDEEYKRLLRPDSKPGQGPELAGGGMLARRYKEIERRKSLEEKIKRMAGTAPLNATKTKDVISSGDPVIP